MHHKDQRESAGNCWIIRSISSTMTKLGCFMQFKHLCRESPHTAFYWQLPINGNFWSFSTYINLLTPWPPLGHFKSSEIIRGDGVKLADCWRPQVVSCAPRSRVERLKCSSHWQQNLNWQAFQRALSLCLAKGRTDLYPDSDPYAYKFKKGGKNRLSLIGNIRLQGADYSCFPLLNHYFHLLPNNSIFLE